MKRCKQTFIPYDYTARSESTIFRRAARAAGRKPPTTPMINANANDLRMISRFRIKLNANSEKDCQFMVEMVKNCMKDAIVKPMMPPAAPSINASTRNAERMFMRRKPNARKVPISVARLATEAYMVIIAPIIAPAEKMIDNIIPR